GTLDRFLSELDPGRQPARRAPDTRLRLEFLALPAAGRALLGRVRSGWRPVRPAVTRRRTDVDVDELATRGDAGAHPTAIERFCKRLDLLRADAGDPDIRGAALEMVAALLALVAVARDDLQRLAAEVVVDVRQQRDQLRVHVRLGVGAAAAKDVVQ